MHKQHLFVSVASVLWGCDIVAVLEVAWSKAAAIINWMAINSSRRQLSDYTLISQLIVHCSCQLVNLLDVYSTHLQALEEKSWTHPVHSPFRHFFFKREKVAHT